MIDHTELEARLRAYGAELRSSLRTDDLSQSVLGQLRSSPQPRRRALARPIRVAIIAGAIVALLATAAYAGYRVLYAAGPITVHTGPPPDAAIGTRLRLGTPIELGDPRIRIPVVTPHDTGIDATPHVWLDDSSAQVSLTFPPQRALPEIGTSGVGLLIQEFDGDGREAIRKYVTTSTRTEAVRIRAQPGVFLSGGEHTLFYLDRTGKYVVSPGRLVGNALIFQRGPLTIRIEAQLPHDQMVELANSLR